MVEAEHGEVANALTALDDYIDLQEAKIATARQAIEAAEAAISNPLLERVSLEGTKGLLLNITGGSDMSLQEVSEAADRIKQIMSTADKSTIGVRVGVKSGGCAGLSYVMEYAKEIKPNEEVIEDKGVKVLIDPKAIMYLLGTEMDYKKEQFSSQFVFKNPNETERCGCGESFKI